MKIREVAKLLNAEILTGTDYLDEEVYSAFACDLMSDVLAFVDNHTILLTGLTNLQVVRTAEMMDMKVIVFVRGKRPDSDVVELAKKKEMVILTTELPMYPSSGILYSNGLGR
ncbi:MAG: hypothetical protein J6A69_07275 [Clostridia bacterium]|nr:hypothetical protein [Clostridia bacterium]